MIYLLKETNLQFYWVNLSLVMFSRVVSLLQVWTLRQVESIQLLIWKWILLKLTMAVALENRKIDLNLGEIELKVIWKASLASPWFIIEILIKHWSFEMRAQLERWLQCYRSCLANALWRLIKLVIAGNWGIIQILALELNRNGRFGSDIVSTVGNNER